MQPQDPFNQPLSPDQPPVAPQDPMPEMQPEPQHQPQSVQLQQPQQFQQPQQNVAPIGQDDPGKTMSLVGLIVAIFIPIVGIPLAAVGMTKSKGAGHTGKLGLVGIIVGIVSIVLTIIIWIALPFLMAGVMVDQVKNASSTDSIVNSMEDSKRDTSSYMSGPSSSETITTDAGGVLKKGMSKSEVSTAMGNSPDNCLENNDGSTSCFYSANFGDLVIFKDDKLFSAVLENRKILK